MYDIFSKHVSVLNSFVTENWPNVQTLTENIFITPGPHLMRIHLVRYSTSARYEKYSNIHLVRPIIHLVRIFALSTS